MRVEMDTTSPAIPQALTEPMWHEVIAQLRAFVRRRIADPDRAEDLVGDIVLRIHQNLGSVDDQEKLAHWVSRVARNAVIDEYRRAARSREQLLDTPDDTAAIAAVGPDAGRCVERARRAVTLPSPAARRVACRAASRRGDDRSRRDAAGRRRAPGGRVVVGDEVACAARASPPGRAARPVLHVDAGCAGRAHGLRARAGLLRGLRLQLNRQAVTGPSGQTGHRAAAGRIRRSRLPARCPRCCIPFRRPSVDAPSGLAGLSSRTV